MSDLNTQPIWDHFGTKVVPKRSHKWSRKWSQSGPKVVPKRPRSPKWSRDGSWCRNDVKVVPSCVLDAGRDHFPGDQFPETTSGPFCKGIFRGTSFAQPLPEGCSGPGTDRSSESQRRSEVSVPAKESRQTEVCLCLTPYISFGSCAEAAKSVLCNEGLRTVIRAVNLAG